MCFAADSTPPITPVSGAAVDARVVTLVAADGNRFAAYEARGDGSGQATVVVLPDVRGLFGFYQELAERFAETGYDAVAIDYFGRTAGVAVRDEAFDYMPHVKLTTHEGVRPTPPPRWPPAIHRGCPGVHRRLLLWRQQLVASGGQWPGTGRGDRVLWPPRSGVPRGSHAPGAAGGGDALPHPRPDGGRRRGDPGRARRRFREHWGGRSTTDRTPVRPTPSSTAWEQFAAES
jgi:hypothetical protein